MEQRVFLRVPTPEALANYLGPRNSLQRIFGGLDVLGGLPTQ